MAVIGALSRDTALPPGVLDPRGYSPFESGRACVGLLVRRGTIEVWNVEGRTPRRAFTLRGHNLETVQVHLEEPWARSVIRIKWHTGSGIAVLGFVPLQLHGIVRLPASRLDARSAVAVLIGIGPKSVSAD